MVAFKAKDAARLIQAPPTQLRGFLLYGTDAGQVSERASALASRLSSSSAPPGEIVRLTDEDIAGSPEKIGVELDTIPMFGGAKVVWVSAQKWPAAALELLGEDRPPASFLVVEAGNLQKSAKLRQVFEQGKSLAALPCYGDEAGDLTRLIQQELSQAGLTINPQALQHLRQHLGADQRLSKSELTKLALYTAPDTEVGLDHIDAITGDVSAFAMDGAIAAAVSGEIAKALDHFDRLIASGQQPAAILLALSHYLLRLHRLRAAADAGEAIAIAIKRLRPPVHFKMEAALAAQCRAWSLPKLNEAIRGVHEAIRQTRLQADLAQAIAAGTISALPLQNRGKRPGRA